MPHSATYILLVKLDIPGSLQFTIPQHTCFRNGKFHWHALFDFRMAGQGHELEKSVSYLQIGEND